MKKNTPAAAHRAALRTAKYAERTRVSCGPPVSAAMCSRVCAVRRSCHHVKCAGQYIDAAAIKRQHLAIQHHIDRSVKYELDAMRTASRSF